MAIYFIADLHLSDHQPQLWQLFQCFLQRLTAGDHLYILGDLLEAWIGDDDLTPFHQRVIDHLADLPPRGIRVYFIHGNRDFLIGPRFANATGLTLLPETYVLTYAGQAYLLLHGDTLCTLDTRYQAFRRKSQQKWLQWLFLHLPLAMRRWIATRLRRQSQQQRVIPADILDVAQDSVRASFRQHQVKVMIHGHTHRPGIHLYANGQEWWARYVLSDWGEKGYFLKLDETGLTSHFFDHSG